MRRAAIQEVERDTELPEVPTQLLVVQSNGDGSDGESSLFPAAIASLSPDRLSHLSTLLGRGTWRGISISTGYSRKHISCALRGKSGLSFIAAQRIADAVGVSTDELRGYLEVVKRANGS